MARWPPTNSSEESHKKQVTNVLRQITRLIKALNSDVAPEQISLAVSFAMIVGLTPFWSLHNLVVLFLVMILRVNIAAFFAVVGLFSLLAYLLDPVFHQFGYSLLRLDALNSVWTSMYNSTIWRIENFNNTIVMGSLVFSLLSFVPVYLMSLWAIKRYREQFMVWVEKLKLTRFLKIQGLASTIGPHIK